MAPKPAKTVIFKAFVNEGPVPAETFEVQESSVDPDSLQDGELLLQLLYLSVDPYLRMMMKDMKSYRAGLIPGEPMASRAVALVKAAGSKAPGLTEGDVVTGTLPWSTLILLDKDAQAAAGLSKVDPVLLGQVPLSYRLGVLGMPGMKAYTSLKKIAEPKPGEVAFVSAASGAVGLVVGQLLKNVYGCKVIGSAGSGEKVKLLQDVGFDAAFNYKETDTARALKEAAPDGLDIYFENVGGQTLEVVLDQARRHARIVACGMVSQYDLPPEERYGVKNLFQIIGKSIKLQGFIVSDFAEELGAEFAADMTQYVLDGKVRVVEHVTKGIENAGRAFIDMMKGGNVGKAIVQVVDQDPFDVVKG